MLTEVRTGGPAWGTKLGEEAEEHGQKENIVYKASWIFSWPTQQI